MTKICHILNKHGPFMFLMSKYWLIMSNCGYVRLKRQYQISVNTYSPLEVWWYLQRPCMHLWVFLLFCCVWVVPGRRTVCNGHETNNSAKHVRSDYIDHVISASVSLLCSICVRMYEAWRALWLHPHEIRQFSTFLQTSAEAKVELTLSQWLHLCNNDNWRLSVNLTV